MSSPLKIVREGIAVSIAVLAIGPAHAGAANLHVTDGSGDCTSAAQGCSLTAALGAAQSGDQILIHAGVHAVTGTVQDTAASGVVVRGAPEESRPVLDLSGGELRLTHGTGLESVDIVAATGTAIVAYGATLDHLRIGVTGADTVGVELGHGAVVRNSTVIASGTDATGVLVQSSGLRSELRGATVLASGTGAAAARVDPIDPAAMSSLRAVNTILSGSAGALDLSARSSGAQSATVVLDHCATDPAEHSVIGPGSAIDTSRATVTSPPRFVDRAAGDLRQTSLSPTIDAGTADIDGDGDEDADDVLAAGTTDLDRTPRRLGDPDIGADEREMPPVVLATEPVYDGDAVSLRVTVQPRGLTTQVAVEWGTAQTGTMATHPLEASGNYPVVLEIPLGTVQSGAQLTVRPRASNSAGTALTTSATLAVPELVRAASISGGAAVGPSTTTTTSKPPAVTKPGLPGALPTLASLAVKRHWGILSVRLKCAQPISCRGMLLLTRVGTPRWTSFAIAPGKRKTITMTLTGAQQRQGNRAGKRGLRALLEIRSTQMGSSFQAVRLKAPAKRR